MDHELRVLLPFVTWINVLERIVGVGLLKFLRMLLSCKICAFGITLIHPGLVWQSHSWISWQMLYCSKMLNLGRMSCILKENVTECSRMPLKLHSKPLEANAATRFHTLPSAIRDNIPRNNERMPCPHGPLGEIAIENECESLKQCVTKCLREHAEWSDIAFYTNS